MCSYKRRAHCVKSVQIWRFFWSVFSRIWTEYRDLLRKSPYSSLNTGKNGPEKLYIWTVFTQWQIWVNCTHTRNFKPTKSTGHERHFGCSNYFRVILRCSHSHLNNYLEDKLHCVSGKAIKIIIHENIHNDTTDKLKFSIKTFFIEFLHARLTTPMVIIL